MSEFPDFIRARSKVKVTTSVPRGWEPKKKKVGYRILYFSFFCMDRFLIFNFR